jgi:nucleotide-binding universal stress UspA family protein
MIFYYNKLGSGGMLAINQEGSMFKKILVPLDGSGLAAKILPKVIDLAKAMQAQVTLLHVCYSPATFGVEEASPAIIEKAADHEAKWCVTFLDQIAKDLQAQGLEVKIECVEGVPAWEIIAYADNNEIDLIAMATHGRGEVAWILGSIAEKVVSHATVPVLLFRVIEVAPPLMKGKLNKLKREAELYLGW